MKRESQLPRLVKRLFTLFLVTLALFTLSFLTTTMVTTATFSTTEAGGILDSIRPENRSKALWAFIIPAAFFVVLSTRNRKTGGSGDR